MKIAIPTSDRIEIFERTGQTPLFAVVTIENLNITHIEYRVNPPHKHTGEAHSHNEIVELLHDCDLLLLKKIGKHLKHDLELAGLKYKITAANEIGSAVHQYLSA